MPDEHREVVCGVQKKPHPLEEPKSPDKSQGFSFEHLEQGPQVGHQQHGTKGEGQVVLDDRPRAGVEFLKGERLFGGREEGLNSPTWRERWSAGRARRPTKSASRTSPRRKTLWRTGRTSQFPNVSKRPAR